MEVTGVAASARLGAALARALTAACYGASPALEIPRLTPGPVRIRLYLLRQVAPDAGALRADRRTALAVPRPAPRRVPLEQPRAGSGTRRDT